MTESDGNEDAGPLRLTLQLLLVSRPKLTGLTDTEKSASGCEWLWMTQGKYQSGDLKESSKAETQNRKSHAIQEFPTSSSLRLGSRL
ncbi:hypothetical protein N7456_002081 [Penicillium angulare]|uniref:Uncharacterized protein n=1 Tax=Penicillium angulare TaxID=116970 RepID=A0A9W9G7Q3_9EURO|nr:hypothetical protein N7456_002081 [Penicillium angulare]